MVKLLRIKSNLEFYSKEFSNFCRDKNSVRHLLICHTPKHIGVAERMNKTLLEMTMSVLSHSGLERQYYDKVLSMICFLVNNSMSIEIVSSKI